MILHFDFSTGASGDKIFGALLEVCESCGVADFADVQRLGALLVPGARVKRVRLERGGVQATSINVVEDDAPVRHWHEIRSLIEEAGAEGHLSRGAAALALRVFEAIAQAEAAVHGCDIERVHFHEVGAADSIIDICYSSLLMDRLRPETVFATPLALGSGTFVCSHGELPVPAPATARLVEGLPVYAGAHDGELTTPTGAALARVFVTAWEPLPSVRPQTVGYGAGSRVIPEAANVVRALVGRRVGLAGLTSDVDRDDVSADVDDTADANVAVVAVDDTADANVAVGAVDSAATATTAATAANAAADATLPSISPILEGCVLLETNIDHLSPEALAFACEELLNLGVYDVWQEPITMKKGRLATRLCVLSSAREARANAERVIGLTGSLGVRSSYVERLCACRKLAPEQTPWGPVTFKTALVATPEGRVKLRRPEYEDVARIARAQGLDFNTLYEGL
jgi:uncharacterized protein (TIGR00299 family) protein